MVRVAVCSVSLSHMAVVHVPGDRVTPRDTLLPARRLPLHGDSCCAPLRRRRCVDSAEAQRCPDVSDREDGEEAPAARTYLERCPFLLVEASYFIDRGRGPLGQERDDSLSSARLSGGRDIAHAPTVDPLRTEAHRPYLLHCLVLRNGRPKTTPRDRCPGVCYVRGHAERRANG